MRKVDGENPRVRAQSRVMGVRSATTGVLFRKPEIEKHSVQSLAKPNLTPVFMPNAFRAIMSASWLRSTAWTTTNKTPTARTPEFVKPEIASLVSMMPAFQTTQSAMKAAMSGVFHPVTSAANKKMIMTITNHGCQDAASVSSIVPKIQSATASALETSPRGLVAQKSNLTLRLAQTAFSLTAQTSSQTNASGPHPQAILLCSEATRASSGGRDADPQDCSGVDTKLDYCYTDVQYNLY
eukprot:3778737-Rhodomonas_salina.2